MNLCSRKKKKDALRARRRSHSTRTLFSRTRQYNCIRRRTSRDENQGGGEDDPTCAECNGVAPLLSGLSGKSSRRHCAHPPHREPKVPADRLVKTGVTASSLSSVESETATAQLVLSNRDF